MWTLTLRDGLLFHDGTPALGRDVVASLRRWAAKDPFAQALMEATAELSAPSDKQVVFRLNRPFPLLPQALAKPTNQMAAIMPERLALTPATTLLNEMVGSGPFRFLPDEKSQAPTTPMRNSTNTCRARAWPVSAPARASQTSSVSSGSPRRTRPLRLPRCAMAKSTGSSNR